MTNLVERARIFATKAHASIDQRRKYTDDPYIVHPTAIVEIVRSVAHDDAMLAAAWLHDVVEDTPVTTEEIENEFGFDVFCLVNWLTKKSRLSDGNRKVRMAKDREYLGRAPARAQTIKVADLIDNTKSIAGSDPHFAETYMREKELLLDVLFRANQKLLRIAREQIEEYKNV